MTNTNPPPRVTINCDIGEGYYRWALGPDEDLMPLCDYANVACGFHAGDQNTMLRTVRTALKTGTRIGAHPGLDDIKGFGRRRLDVTPEEVYALALYQLGALKAIVEAEGATLSHVKPHGMLYFIIRDSRPHMEGFLRAQTSIFGTSIPFFGLPRTHHADVCAEMGVPFVPELFLDIDYTKERTLLGVPQSHKPTPERIKMKLEKVFRETKTIDIDGNDLAMDDYAGTFTICMHSDMPTALANVTAVREVVDKLLK